MPLTLPPLGQMQPQQKIEGIRIVCLGGYDGFDFSGRSDWPQYTLFPPRVGDMLQSQGGVMKKIIEVIHFASADGQPGCAVKLGDDRTSVTPTEVGGTDTY